MKKSEMYRTLQEIVMRDDAYTDDFRLSMLRELMTQEDLAKFAEEQEAKKDEAV